MKRTLSAIVLLILISGSANASLLSRAGGQAYYDTDLNITWLTDANLAASNRFGVSAISSVGQMDWNTAEAWIAAMNASNGGLGYLGASNWRLPTTGQPDATCEFQSNQSGFPLQGYGYNCTGSEMGHLRDVTGIPFFSPSPFVHVYDYYWSGTEFPLEADVAWVYYFVNGWQDGAFKFDLGKRAWAVSPGDLLSVPIPPTAFLFPSALGLLGLRRRK